MFYGNRSVEARHQFCKKHFPPQSAAFKVVCFFLLSSDFVIVHPTFLMEVLFLSPPPPYHPNMQEKKSQSL
jgi:hypothetical protein